MFEAEIVHADDMLERMEAEAKLTMAQREGLPEHQRVPIPEAVAWEQAVEKKLKEFRGTDAVARYELIKAQDRRAFEQHLGDELSRYITFVHNVVRLLRQLERLAPPTHPVPAPVVSTSGPLQVQHSETTTPKIFVSYSHKDKDWLDRLQEQFAPLARGAFLVAWDDTRIAPGKKWREEITRAIDEADIAVLLVSPGFLASDFIAQHELKPLLEKKRVFWIAVKYSNYAVTDIGQYQCANDPGKPLAILRGDARNRAWVEICKKILAASGSP